MICQLCEKRRMVGNKVSHSNIKTKKKQMPNVQKVNAIINGTPQRLKVCTRCLSSNRVIKSA